MQIAIGLTIEFCAVSLQKHTPRAVIGDALYDHLYSAPVRSDHIGKRILPGV